MKSYLNELNAQVEEQRGRLASVKQDQAAAARGRLTLLDARLKCLLDTIPPEVQTEGLSIVADAAPSRASALLLQRWPTG